MRRLPGVALVFACVLGWCASARPADGDFPYYEPYFESVGDAESIPFGVVNALAQDRNGFLWIGTQNGLIRWDGYRFRRYVYDAKDPQSLAGNSVSALYEGDGRLWIGTETEGLSVFDPRTDRFTNFGKASAHADDLANGRVWALAGDSSGAVWIATHDRGLLRTDADGAFTRFRQADGGLVDDRVRSLLIDRGGDLWIGSAQGLQRRRRGSDTFERIASDPAVPESLAQRRVMALHEAADGKLWLGTHDYGAAWLDPVSATLHWVGVDPARPDRLNHPWIRRIVQPRPEEIWLATNGGGINVVSADDGRVLRRLRHDPALPSSLALDGVGALLLERSGLLWVGTFGGGLQRIDPRQDAFRHVRHVAGRGGGLSHPDVRSILETVDGRILVGTGGNGIDILDRRFGVVGGHHPDPGRPGALPDGNIGALAETPDGALWVATLTGGLQRLAPGADAFVGYGTDHGLPTAIAVSLLVARDGALWVGSNAGLTRWNPGTERFDNVDPDFRYYVSVITQDTDGRIWLGTPNGLFVIDDRNDKPKAVPRDPANPKSLVHDAVSGMLVDRAGRLWVDTQRGLDRLERYADGRAEFVHVSDQVGRPGLYFGANLLEDTDGRIWTQWYVLDPSKPALHALSRADGLDIGTAWASSYAKTRDGLFLFGGTQGLVVVDPRRFAPWAYEPPVVVSEYKVNGKPRLPAELAGASLAPSDRSFSVEFAALDFSAPGKLRYSYRLDGFDTGWIDADAEHRSASYSNLWPGDYTLRVRGSNRLGAWSPHELALPLTIRPAFWQTAWFAVLVALALVGVAYAGYKLRVARLHVRALELQRLVDQRTTELRDSLQRETEHERLLAREKLASATLLTGGLAHEINNPISFAALAAQNLRDQLQTMKAFLHELAGDDAEPDVLRAVDQRFVPLDGFIDDILDGSRRVSGIVADLRRFSQPDPPEPTRAQLGELLRATLRLVGAKYKHYVHFACDLAVDPPVPCFPARINQVFTNLIVNACDAIEARAKSTPDGFEGLLRVSSRIVDGRVEFRFEDNGIGMDDAVRTHIFEPFFTTKAGGKGTGLGLPVSLAIVREHGGRIDFETRAGVGSVFSVHLPLQREAAS